MAAPAFIVPTSSRQALGAARVAARQMVRACQNSLDAFRKINLTCLSHPAVKKEGV